MLEVTLQKTCFSLSLQHWNVVAVKPYDGCAGRTLNEPLEGGHCDRNSEEVCHSIRCFTVSCVSASFIKSLKQYSEAVQSSFERPLNSDWSSVAFSSFKQLLLNVESLSPSFQLKQSCWPGQQSTAPRQNEASHSEHQAQCPVLTPPLRLTPYCVCVCVCAPPSDSALLAIHDLSTRSEVVPPGTVSKGATPQSQDFNSR